MTTRRLSDERATIELMDHDPRCPAYGNPKWVDVDECGPCDHLAQTDAALAPA